MMFKYKNWSLYALFNVQWGGHARLPKLYDTDSNYGIPTPEQNVSRDLARRWRKAGDKTNIPSIPTSEAYKGDFMICIIILIYVWQVRILSGVGH